MAHFTKSVVALAPSQVCICHSPPMLVTSYPACFPAMKKKKKKCFLSGILLSPRFKEHGDKLIIIKKKRSGVRLANIITRYIKKLNIAQCFENQAPREAEDVLSLGFMSLFKRNAVIE